MLHEAYARLNLSIVAREDFGQLCRHTRTATILEQECVEQRISVIVPDARLGTEPHADKCAANRVAQRVALCQVKGVREHSKSIAEPRIVRRAWRSIRGRRLLEPRRTAVHHGDGV